MATSLRRSTRIAKLPPVKYADLTADKQQDILDMIQDYCSHNGYTFTPELFDEFKTYLCSLHQHQNTLITTDSYLLYSSLKTIKRDFHHWANWASERLENEVKLAQVRRYIIRYCFKNNIKYQSIMLQKYLQWYILPTTIPILSYKQDGRTYNRPFTYHYCINKWFSTLKKTVEL